MKERDLVLNFYKDKKLLCEPRAENLEADIITIQSLGVGDTVTLTHLPKNAKAVGKDLGIYSRSRCFVEMVMHNNYYDPSISGKRILPVEVAAQNDWGGGHTIQRMCKAFGLQVEHAPKGYFNEQNLSRDFSKSSYRIGLHLSTGASAWGNKQHPQPRQIYQQNVDVLEEFAEENSNYTFFEFGGSRRTKSKFVVDKCGITISDSIVELASCDFFIGVNSGFMNIAAALGIPSIIVVNWPEAHQLYLPMLKYCGIGDLDWLYPQNVHLHQDGENPLVPRFSKKSLSAAINGEVYPYWDYERFAGLLPDFESKRGLKYDYK